MGGEVLQNVLLFLVQTLLSIYVFVLLVRALLTLARADFYNPVSQFIARVTDPPLLIMRKLMPSFGQVDLSCWLLAYMVKLLQLTLLVLIKGHVALMVEPLLLVSFIQLAESVISVYIFALIILAVSSWFMTGAQYYNPAIMLIHSLVAPLLDPIRRRIPQTGPFDFSVLILLLLLYLLQTILHSLY